MSQEKEDILRPNQGSQNNQENRQSNASHSFEIKEKYLRSNSTSESKRNEEIIDLKKIIKSEKNIKDDDIDNIGGEWEMLLKKISNWWIKYEFSKDWIKFLRISFLVSILVILSILLGLYSGVLDALRKFPLIPEILELIGLYSALKFASMNLVRASSRRKFFSEMEKKIIFTTRSPNQKQNF